ncbi:CRE-SLR-2 protein [Caenorhabditis remanei]|uniref:CRE-SLR-2 protein n=1 Tax=Caenorhabditis remanei TaxID=31234 RepID=E3MFA1_CAERE|nr:CRE-SLR-2 protein [Caenorhabditis remanei]
MSINEPLFSKENWQNYGMNPGPSYPNNVLLSLPTPQKIRQTSAGKAMKQTWTCTECRKELSSKRSFTEHMNIHTKSRPFQCEHCAYAAASQMTLHRHKLRNHTPKTEWGYRCPYCEDAYMEPAGYQSHVQQRHAGRSATYGCPFGKCKFTSKSQRHFREHLLKHEKTDKTEGGVDPCALSNQQLVRYMVADEMGHGFKRVGGTPAVTIRARPQPTIAPKIYSTPNDGTPQKVVWRLESVIPNKTIIRTNQLIPPRGFYVHQNPEDSEDVTTTIQNPSESMPSGSSDQYPSEEFHDNEYYDVDDDDDEEEILEYIEDEEEEEGAELIEERAEHFEYDDEEGPPILESFEDPQQQQMDDNWGGVETKEVFPNGFIDDELD